MSTIRITIFTAILMLTLSGVARAQICLQILAGGGEQWILEITNATGDTFSLAGREPNVNRAVYGSAQSAQAGTFGVGLTKNTSAATVQFQCQLDAATLQGPSQVHVFFSDPFSSSENLGTCAIVSCAANSSSSSTQKLLGE